MAAVRDSLVVRPSFVLLTCCTFEFIVMSLFRGVLGLFCFKTLVRGIGKVFWYM